MITKLFFYCWFSLPIHVSSEDLTFNDQSLLASDSLKMIGHAFVGASSVLLTAEIPMDQLINITKKTSQLFKQITEEMRAGSSLANAKRVGLGRLLAGAKPSLTDMSAVRVYSQLRVVVQQHLKLKRSVYATVQRLEAITVTSSPSEPSGRDTRGSVLRTVSTVLKGFGLGFQLLDLLNTQPLASTQRYPSSSLRALHLRLAATEDAIQDNLAALTMLTSELEEVARWELLLSSGTLANDVLRTEFLDFSAAVDSLAHGQIHPNLLSISDAMTSLAHFQQSDGVVVLEINAGILYQLPTFVEVSSQGNTRLQASTIIPILYHNRWMEVYKASTIPQGLVAIHSHEQMVSYAPPPHEDYLLLSDTHHTILAHEQLRDCLTLKIEDSDKARRITLVCPAVHNLISNRESESCLLSLKRGSVLHCLPHLHHADVVARADGAAFLVSCATSQPLLLHCPNLPVRSESLPAGTSLLQVRAECRADINSVLLYGHSTTFEQNLKLSFDPKDLPNLSQVAPSRKLSNLSFQTTSPSATSNSLYTWVFPLVLTLLVFIIGTLLAVPIYFRFKARFLPLPSFPQETEIDMEMETEMNTLEPSPGSSYASFNHNSVKKAQFLPFSSPSEEEKSQLADSIKQARRFLKHTPPLPSSPQQVSLPRLPPCGC